MTCIRSGLTTFTKQLPQISEPCQHDICIEFYVKMHVQRKKIKNLCLLNNHLHLIDTDENRVANKFFALHFLQVCRALVSVVVVGNFKPPPEFGDRGVRKEEIKINRKSITLSTPTKIVSQISSSHCISFKLFSSSAWFEF